MLLHFRSLCDAAIHIHSICLTAQYSAFEITHAKRYFKELKKVFDYQCLCFYYYNCPVESLQMIKLIPIFSTVTTKNMVHGPAASMSPGRWLEMQNLRSHPRPIESESAFNKIPR